MIKGWYRLGSRLQQQQQPATSHAASPVSQSSFSTQSVHVEQLTVPASHCIGAYIWTRLRLLRKWGRQDVRPNFYHLLKWGFVVICLISSSVFFLITDYNEYLFYCSVIIDWILIESVSDNVLHQFYVLSSADLGKNILLSQTKLLCFYYFGLLKRLMHSLSAWLMSINSIPNKNMQMSCTKNLCKRLGTNIDKIWYIYI